MTFSQQREKGEIVPEAVCFSFGKPRKALVTPVVPYFGVFASALRALLVLVKPGPKIGRNGSASGTFEVVFILNFYS